MHIIPLILALFAIAAAGIEWYRTRSLLAAWATLYTIAWTLVLTLEGGERYTFG